MFTFKAGELLNKSNYRLCADDIIVDYYGSCVFVKMFAFHSLLSYVCAVLYSSLILLERRYILVSIDFTFQVVISNLSE